MNPQLIFDIATLVLSLAQSLVTGTGQQGVTVANILLQIVQKGAQAYKQQTGQALDPALILAEEPI